MVGDLARLATKYKAKDWEELAQWLDDPGHQRTFHSLLMEFAEVSAASKQLGPRKKKRQGQAAKVRGQLKKIRSQDPERADLLEDVWLKLRQRELLPTIASIRSFADAIGAKSLKSTRRDQAVTELMELLIRFPEQSFELKLREALELDDRNPSDEYETWVRLILDRRDDG